MAYARTPAAAYVLDEDMQVVHASAGELGAPQQVRAYVTLKKLPAMKRPPPNLLPSFSVM